MGANAQTAVPAFTAGQVLTAAQQTQINTGIPVFASSVERDAAFGGTGEKVLAEGQYAYLESTNQTLVYDGSNWVSVSVAPGLVLVKTQTIGTTVASVAVTDAFSATYDAYKIVVSGGVGSVSSTFNMVLGASATGYNSQLTYASYGSTPLANGASNNNLWFNIGNMDTTAISIIMDINNPFLAKNTSFASSRAGLTVGGSVNGIHTVASSFTGFTFSPDAGTITGGTIRVYGYANS
jgi:hypothetical protein